MRFDKMQAGKQDAHKERQTNEMNTGTLGERRERRRFPVRAFVWTLFAVQLAVRIAVSVFTKIGTTYGDELLYLELSQSLWTRGTLALYGLPVKFSKILYPLALSPFYAIQDPMARMTAISVFNAVLVSGAMIPGYLLARRILRDDRLLCLAMAVLALMPDMFFSATFMAENLYLPLLLWGFCFAYRTFEQERPKTGSAFLLGGWAFLLYLAKEAGAAFAAAGFCIYAVRVFRTKETRKEALLQLLAYSAALLVPFFLVRLTVFGRVPYSYEDQAGAGNLDSIGKWGFLAYAAFYMLLYYLQSVLFFPAAVPVLQRRKLPPAQRRMTSLAGLYILMVAAGIAFAISIPDDYGKTDALRIHLRYFIGTPFVLMLLFFARTEQEDGSRESRFYRSPLFWAALAFAAACLAVLQPIRFGSLVDAPALYAATELSGAGIRISILYTGIILLLLLLQVTGLRKKMAWVLAAVLLLSQAANGISFIRTARTAEAPPEDPAEAIALNRLMESLQGNILVVKDSVFNPYERMLDTYSDVTYYAVGSEELKELAFTEEGTIDLDEVKLPPVLPRYTADPGPYRAENVCYVVTSDATVQLAGSAGREITPEGFRRWRVFEAGTPNELVFFDTRVYRVGETITFYGDANCGEYAIRGFAGQESEFRWTEGNCAEIALRMAETGGEPLELVLSVAATIGVQHCEFTINGEPVHSCVLQEAGDIRFRIPEEVIRKSGNRLHVQIRLEDAKQPGNGDPRLLGLAVRELRIQAAEP